MGQALRKDKKKDTTEPEVIDIVQEVKAADGVDGVIKELGAKDIEISDPWAGKIFSGEKKVEVRKNKPDGWGATKVGDKLNVIETKDGQKTGHSQVFEVVQCRTYKSLTECFKTEGVSSLLPGKETLEEAEEVYLGFDGKEGIEARRQEFDQFGVIVIQLKAA